MPVATRRGGAEATLLDLLRFGRTDARWLVVFLEDGPMVEVARSLEAETLVVPAGRVRDFPRLIKVVRRLGGALRSWDAHVAVSWMSKAHLYTAPAASLQGLPSLWFQHGLPKSNDPIDRLVALAPASGVLACSRAVARAQEAIWPHRTTRVIHPGIDMNGEFPTTAARDALAASLGIPSDAPIVGMVGRLQRWKGMHVLIEAMPSLLDRFPDLHAVIVGGDHPLEPGYREDLDHRIRALGLEHCVHLAGYQQDARRWMAAFDVAIHASDNEPFGLVVLEAMALGKPVVAGANGGPSEVIEDGIEGFLVEYGDHRKLANRVAEYLGDPHLARTMAAAGARRASGFTAARFADQVVSELRSHARLAA